MGYIERYWDEKEQRYHEGLFYFSCDEQDSAIPVLGHVFGFCGCGENEEALIYIRDVLLMLKLYWNAVYEKEERTKNTINKAFENYFQSEGEMYFCLYRLDDLELIEHGVNVRWSWLTEKGELILEDLVKYLED